MSDINLFLDIMLYYTLIGVKIFGLIFFPVAIVMTCKAMFNLFKF